MVLRHIMAPRRERRKKRGRKKERKESGRKRERRESEESAKREREREREERAKGERRESKERERDKQSTLPYPLGLLAAGHLLRIDQVPLWGPARARAA